MKTFITIGAILLSIALYGQDRHWTSPDHLVLQYAGSIGEFSGGVGYNIFKNKARTSFHFGYVSEPAGGPLHIFSGKMLFIPRSYHLADRVVVNPFDFGIMFSYHFGERFRSRWPDQQYPDNYYWWKTSLHVHLNIESSLTLRFKDRNAIKAMTAYFEFNSNELYLVSLFQNLEGLSVGDVVKIGVGTRLHF